MTGIGTQIKNALGWFLTKLKGNVVNNLTSTSTDLPLSAAKGKDLQDQISTLNTKISWAKIYTGSKLLGSGGLMSDTQGFSGFQRFKITFICQGFRSTAEFLTNKAEQNYAHSFGYMGIDGTHRQITVNFTTSGRYFTNVKSYMQQNTGAWADASASIYITEIYASNDL